MTNSLASTAHRPYPLPSGQWAVAMRWHDLLFAHWPVSADALRPLIPAPLEVDTFDGQAWIGIVPFRMSGVRIRPMPSRCSLAFAELNVRTYVRHGQRRGVWFFSLDAANRLAVRVARSWYGVPYFDARITVRHDGEQVAYDSLRSDRAGPPVRWQAEYGPVGPILYAQPGTLDHWLIERYCLFSRSRRGHVGCGEIHHVPWPLQPAAAAIRCNTMTAGLGLTLPEGQPVLHFARELDVVAWSVRPLAADNTQA